MYHNAEGAREYARRYAAEALKGICGDGDMATVGDITNPESPSWYGFWRGVQVLITRGHLDHVVTLDEIPSWPNGYGGDEVTGAHSVLVEAVTSTLKNMGVEVVE